MSKGSVFVSGIFNVLHPGHLRLFKYARDHGDRLIVGVLSDQLAGQDAHVPEGLRLEAVKLNALVDDAFLVTTTVVKEISARKPAVVVKGKEHSFRENAEADAVAAYGGRLLFSSGDVTFTSQDLIRREIESLEFTNVRIPRAFLERHAIDMSHLMGIIRRFAELRVVVVGDTIVDEYITCEPLGMSGEDPTVVVAPISEARFAGGAAVVSAHGSNLGAKVDLLTVLGTDEIGDYAVNELRRFGVDVRALRDDSRPTTLKQRYRANEKTLLRVSRLSQRSIDPAIQEALCLEAEGAIKSADVLIFSDFNYGVLPQAVVDRLSSLGMANDVLMAADSQSSSQIGDISRFRGMTLLSATERETRLALKDSEGGVNTVAQGLLAKTGSQQLLMKLGADGAIVLRRGAVAESYEIDQIPAFNQSPRDVAGAGDSMLVVASLALASGASIWEASVIASIAAAVQVSRVGNIPLRAEDLLRELAE